MTFSILARDPLSGAFGIAIASRFFAVGAICPFIVPGLGAFSTQAAGFPPFGARVETLLREGRRAPDVLAALLSADPERETRQLHLLDRTGRAAARTGTENIPVAGHRTGLDVSVAGNMLASDAVLDAAITGFASAPGGLVDRLLLALEAAQAAGGDHRGQQAASLLVHGAQPFPLLSLRVDDDPDAVTSLRRLRQAAEADYIPYMRRFASPTEIEGVFGA